MFVNRKWVEIQSSSGMSSNEKPSCSCQAFCCNLKKNLWKKIICEKPNYQEHAGFPDNFSCFVPTYIVGETNVVETRQE